MQVSVGYDNCHFKLEDETRWRLEVMIPRMAVRLRNIFRRKQGGIMDSRIKEIQSLESKIKELKAQEDSFWSEVERRLPEIKQRFSLVERDTSHDLQPSGKGVSQIGQFHAPVIKDEHVSVPSEKMSSPKGKNLASHGQIQRAILEGYTAFGGDKRQREIASELGVDQSEVSNQFTALKMALFTPGSQEITGVDTVSKNTGLSHKFIVDKAFSYLAKKTEAKPVRYMFDELSNVVTPEAYEKDEADYEQLEFAPEPAIEKPAWFSDIPFDMSDFYAWLSSVNKWYKSRMQVIHKILSDHKMSLSTSNEKTVLNKIYRLIDEDFGICLDDKKADLGVKNAINVIKSDPVVRVYFDAQLQNILISGKFVPSSYERKDSVEIAKEYVKTIDPEYIAKVRKFADQWVEEIILKTSTPA